MNRLDEQISSTPRRRRRPASPSGMATSGAKVVTVSPAPYCPCHLLSTRPEVTPSSHCAHTRAAPPGAERRVAVTPHARGLPSRGAHRAALAAQLRQHGSLRPAANILHPTTNDCGAL